MKLFGNCNGGPEGSLANYLYSISTNLDIQGSEINLTADEKIYLSGYPGYDVDDWGNIGVRVITNGIEYQLRYGLWYGTGGNPRTDKFITGYQGTNIYFFNIYSSYTDQTWKQFSRNIRDDLTSIGISVGPTIHVTGISYDIRPSSYSTISVNGAWDGIVIKSDGVVKYEEQWPVSGTLNQPIPGAPPAGGMGAGKIAFVSDRSGTDNIWSIYSNGTGLTQLTSDSIENNYHPDWSPVDNKLVWEKSDPGQGGSERIWEMNTDGSGKIQLTTEPGNIPYWSPDGTKIMFRSQRTNYNGWFYAYMMNSYGSNQQIIGSEGTECEQDWSPDSTRVIYSMADYAGLLSDIYVANSDGSNKIKIASGKTFCTPVAWSPDGQKIAYVSEETGNREIFTINPDGTEKTQLTNNPSQDNFRPDDSSFVPRKIWSPDSQKILFVSDRNGDWDIYSINRDGTGLTQLTNDAAKESAVQWSPDGSMIAYISDKSGINSIWLMNSDGSNQIQVTDNVGNAKSLIWSSFMTSPSTQPGGGQILLSDNFESYAPGTWPSSGWDPFWNVITDSTNNKITNEYSREGSNSMQIYGDHSGCWGAMTQIPVALPKQYYIEASMMASGDAFTSSSCHSWAGDIHIGVGSSSGTDDMVFFRFMQDGLMHGVDGSFSFSAYDTNNWYDLKMNVNQEVGTVDYWINGNYVGQRFSQALMDKTSTYPYLFIGSGGGRGWVDNIKVYTSESTTTSITISPSTATVDKDKTKVFTATDQNGNPISVDWSSSDPSVGTVSPASGTSTTFNALKAGAATVTATNSGVVGSASVTVGSGLVAEYHFDGDARDSSGNGNDGTINGAAFVDGVSGQALSFDGVDDYVDAGNDASLNVGTGDFTAMAWVKPAELKQSGIVNKGYYFYGTGWILDMPYNNGILRLETGFNGGDAGTVQSSAGTMTLDEWQFVAVSANRTGITNVYRNDVLVGSGYISSADLFTTNTLKIGVITGCFFNGLIDEVRVYDRALSAEEIKAQYDAIVDVPTPEPPVHNINKSTNYSTIQAAINDASPSDEIHVDSGTYFENVNVNKQVTLRGIGMPVVDAGGSGSAITLAADGIVLEGFTATGGIDYEAGIVVISNNNTLSGNNASNNIYGISLGSSHNTIIDNNALNNGYGIILGSSSNNTLRGNNVNSNNWGGIFLSYSNNNIIVGNNVSNNNNAGISLVFSSNNNIYHNNIINNINQADDNTVTNFWDSGYPSGGNYWGYYYTGEDLKRGSNQNISGSDGIGDTPYPIIGGRSDKYPLMAPYTGQPLKTDIHNINNGANYTTIQWAINDASPGDEIHVDSGIYYENVNVNKQLILRGIGKPVVDAGGSGSAITLAADGIVLEGFTATGGGNINYHVAGIKVISSMNTLNDNNATNNGCGIDLSTSTNNTLSGNNANMNNNFGIFLQFSSNNILSGNNANSNFYGIFMDSANNNILSSNNANSNNYMGFFLVSTSNNILSGNNANSNYYNGIFMASTNNSTLSGNNAVSNEEGISIRSSSNNILSGNNAIGNSGEGIDLYSSSNNTLSGNIATNNVYGIYLYSSSNNTLSGNNPMSNNVGIYLQSSSNNNTLGGNSATSNGASIYLRSSSNNTLFYNNLVNNNILNAYDNNNNVWDNGFIGNHYSNFDEISEGCSDRNGNGICDSSYSIPGGSSVDRYPLVIWSATTPDTTPPAQVVGLTKDNITETTADVHWTSNAESDLWGYEVFRNGTHINYTRQAWYNDSGLTSKKVYQYLVRANDTSGNWGINSSVLEVKTPDTTAPSSVTDLKNITYAETSINWTWTNPPDQDFAYVETYINNNRVENVNVQFYNATNLIPDTQNTISTHTVDTSGNINETWVNHTDRTAPLPPILQSPGITGFAPSTPVWNIEGTARTFNISINQIANVTWYINGTEVSNQTDVLESSYTNSSASTGTWNVTASVQNVNGSTGQKWIWQVAVNLPPSIELISPLNNTIIKDTSKPIDLSIIDENLDYAWYIHDGISRILESPYDINISSWTDGAQAIEVHAKDMKGLESIQNYNFIVDISPPNITKFFSFPRVPYNDDQISFTAQIYDDSPITVQLEYSLDYGKTFQSTEMTLKSPSIYNAKIGPFIDQSDLIIARVIASDGENSRTMGIYVPIKSEKPSLEFNYREPMIDGILGINDDWQIEKAGFNSFTFGNDMTIVDNQYANLSFSRNISHLFGAFEINASQDSVIKLSVYFDSSLDKKLVKSHTDGFEITFDNDSIISSKDLVYDNETSQWLEDNSFGGSNDIEAKSSCQNGKYVLEMAKLFNSSDNLDNNANISRSLIVIDVFSNNEHKYLIWPGMTRSGLIPVNQSGIESFAGKNDPFASRNWADITFSNKLKLKTHEPNNYQMFSRGEMISYNVSVLDSKQKFVDSDAVYATFKNDSNSITKLNLNGDTYKNSYSIPINIPIGIKELIINATDRYGNYGESHLFVYTLDAYIASISLNKTMIISGESILGNVYVSRPNDPSKFLNDSQVNVTIEIIDENNITVIPERKILSSIMSNKPLFSDVINTNGFSKGIYTAKINISDSIGNLVEYRNKFIIVENYSISTSTDKNTYERNNAVNISGKIQYANGTFVSNATVKLNIIGKHGIRTFATISNEEGSYHYEFTPFETEAGNYELTASTEVNGLSRQSSASFAIIGMIFSSRQINVQMFKGTSTDLQLKIINVGEAVQHDVSINLNDTNLTDGVSANLIGWSISDLNGGETKIINVRIDSTLNSLQDAAFEFTVNSLEGSSDKIMMKVILPDGNPQINIDPVLTKLNSNPGTSIIKTITITNTGYGILKNARIVPPTSDWIKINRNLTLGDILPNKNLTFELLIYPSSDIAIGRYINNFSVLSSNYPELKAWIDVSLISSKNGSVAVHAIDEYLGTNVSSTKVNLFSQEVQGLNFEKIGDTRGIAEFKDISAGRYTYVISADKYEPKKGTIDIEPALVTENSQEVSILLHPAWLDIAFSVTPTTITDKYDVTLQMTLDAQVPIPVLQAIPNQLSYTLTPGSLITNQSIDLYNLGLIPTKNIKITPNTNSGFKIDLLSDSLSELKAKNKTQILFDISLDLTTPHGIQIENYINISGEFLYSKDGVEKMVPLNDLSIPVHVTVPVSDIDVIPHEMTIPLEPGGVYSSEFIVKNIGHYQINNIHMLKNLGDSDISINLPVNQISVLLPGESKAVKYSVRVSNSSNWNKTVYNFINISGTENSALQEMSTNFGVIVEIPDRVAQLSGSSLSYSIEPGDHITPNPKIIIKNTVFINSPGSIKNVPVKDINITYYNESNYPGDVHIDEISVMDTGELHIDSLNPGEEKEISLQIHQRILLDVEKRQNS